MDKTKNLGILVVWNMFFSIQLGMEKSSQLMNSYVFFRGVGRKTTNQDIMELKIRFGGVVIHDIPAVGSPNMAREELGIYS